MREITNSLEKVINELFDVELDVELTRPDEQFGDYATNVALRLSKNLGQNPRDIAQKIIDEADVPGATLELAGPGFINITLSDSQLLKQANTSSKMVAEGVVVIETNNPNPFKAMHIGHAFNAILGDTLANLLELTRSEVHRVSYHGDVGAHVGKSMYSLLAYVDGNPSKLNEIPANERNSFMSKMYAQGAKAYKEDETAKVAIDELSQQSFTLEDPIYKEVYDTCKEWSFEQIDSIVARLGNEPIEKRYLESEADALGVKTVKEHIGTVFTESDGAIIFPGKKYGSFDNAYVTSHGRGLYGARDLGLMRLKHDDFHAQHSYIVTAEEQKDYFKGVIKASELIDPATKGVTVNISTGTVKLSTGKMSSRSGEVLEISWLFDQMASAMKERGGKADDIFVAGALRYQFLKVRIGSDVIFDVNESVSLQGNSGPYLQYAHARARSILAKANPPDGTALQTLTLQKDERSLLRKVGEYAEVVERASKELMPHYICTYLYELAQVFNRFYEANRVIGDEREALRLELINLYTQKLKSGLELLGIYAPEKM